MHIYVGNLPLETTKEELLQEFVVYGVVIRTIVFNDKHIGSGQLRGYGYVEMTSISEGQAAINSLEGKTIGGRVITVVESLPFSEKRGMSIHERENNRGVPLRGNLKKGRVF